MVSISRLSAQSCRLLGEINAVGAFFSTRQSRWLIIPEIRKACQIEKNVPIAFILPNRWQDGAESLGIETTSCF